MSETHTPGPWWVDGPPENQIVWREGDNRVCFLAHSNGRDPERDLATGRLIAAAPDLLSIAQRWAALDGGAWDIHRHARDKAELLADTRRAIAKATGEAGR